MMMHLWLLLAVIMPRPIAVSQEDMRPSEAEVIAFIQRLSAPDWDTRRDSFYDLLGTSASAPGKPRIADSLSRVLSIQGERSKEAIHCGLIKLLQTESSHTQILASQQQRMSETYSNYFGDVVAAVAALHDERALDPLLAVSSTGNMAIDAIAGFGLRAFDKVLHKAYASSPIERHSALIILARMITSSIIAKGSPELPRAKAAILSAAGDRAPLVRMGAVQGLGSLLPDKDATRILHDLADKDPARLPGQGEDASDLFPVRRVAKLELSRHR